MSNLGRPSAPPAAPPIPMLPWNHPALRAWSIVGMNHYHLEGQRRLFVAMTKEGRCIKAEGVDEAWVFERLIAQAQVPEALASWELVKMHHYRLEDEPRVFVEMIKGDRRIMAEAPSADLAFTTLIMKAGARPELPIRESTP